MGTKKLFICSFSIQKELIEKYCFRCPEMIVAPINVEPLGYCSQCHCEVCNFEEKIVELGEIESGEMIIVRKLKPL